MNRHTATNSDDRLSQLLDKTELWRASRITRQLNSQPNSGISTGFKQLDQLLPDQGWPNDGITELLHDQFGIGEARLLNPALAKLSQQGRSLLWVSPPYIPYAPALAIAGVDLKQVLVVNPQTEKDKLWVLEKALASHSCAAVLAWPGNISATQVKRLQLASKTGKSLGILYRPSQSAKSASPAELRIQLKALAHSPLQDTTGISVKILKRKGGWQTEYLTLKFGDRLNQVTPDFSELHVQRYGQSEIDLAMLQSQFITRHVRQ